MGAVFACAATAGSVGAASFDTARRPAELPPASYTGHDYVDSRGCLYLRGGRDGGAPVWLPALTATGEVRCGDFPTRDTAAVTPVRRPAAQRGTISPLTGFPVPPGYKVAWEDGRLNPARGLPAGAN